MEQKERKKAQVEVPQEYISDLERLIEDIQELAEKAGVEQQEAAGFIWLDYVKRLQEKGAYMNADLTRGGYKS